MPPESDPPHDDAPEPLEAVPASEDVLRELSGVDLEGQLRELTRHVQEVVPECVGLSVTVMRDGVAVTLAASHPHLRVLDAVQYLDGGPCVDAAQVEIPRQARRDDPLDEHRWSTFTRATAWQGVGSTLSLPLYDDQGDPARLLGSLNIYASIPNAFDIGHGRVDRLARMVRAPAAEAIRDADLSLARLTQAAQVGDALEDLGVVDRAVGMYAERHQCDVGVARGALQEAADQAGVALVELAGALLDAAEEDRLGP